MIPWHDMEKPYSVASSALLTRKIHILLFERMEMMFWLIWVASYCKHFWPLRNGGDVFVVEFFFFSDCDLWRISFSGSFMLCTP